MNIIETVYAFGFFNGKFRELGKCIHVENDYHEYDYMFRQDIKLDKNSEAWETYVYAEGGCYKVSKERNKVYKHRMVYLEENNVEKAIELFENDFKSEMLEKIAKAEETCNNRLEILKRYDND